MASLLLLAVVGLRAQDNPVKYYSKYKSFCSCSILFLLFFNSRSFFVSLCGISHTALQNKLTVQYGSDPRSLFKKSSLLLGFYIGM